MSGDPEQEYFTDGMTEDIITALTHWRSFPVIARNSSFSYKNKPVDIKQAGLTDTLSRIADHKITRIDKLLPWRYAQT